MTINLSPGHIISQILNSRVQYASIILYLKKLRKSTNFHLFFTYYQRQGVLINLIQGNILYNDTQNLK